MTRLGHGACGFDDFVYSFRMLGGGRAEGIAVRRDTNSRAFDEEDRNVLETVLLVPVIISILLQAAHLVRWFGPPGFLALVPLLLLPSRRRVAARVLQVVLVLSTLEWLRTLATLVAEREAAGQSWTRLGLILGGVAIFTALSALAFYAPPLARRYGAGREHA